MGRAFGATPGAFGALSLALHAAAAAGLGALLLALGRPRRVAAMAAGLFLLAPQNLDAAYWYAASTDLLATAFTLAALAGLLRGRAVASTALALAAYLSKESALILPVLGWLVLAAQGAPSSTRQRLGRLAPHTALALVVLGVRWRVLRGWGGSGDPVASWPGKALQLASGLVHVFPGGSVFPEPLAWGLGAALLALLLLSSGRRARAGQGPTALAPLLVTAVALAPLAAAGWLVGARYFYLPSVGLAWAAAEALAAGGLAAPLTAAGVLLAIGAGQGALRAREVTSYERRVAAARRAVADGARQGHRVFHVSGGVKDLDLAVKEDPQLASFADDLLVLGDVPASFALVPPALAAAASIVIAAPPLPPAGAYAFGQRRIVGLARRGDDPSLAEVLERFPDIRFIRLRPVRGGQIIARDVTDELSPSRE
jgi:hypothetical protein